jgi:flagellar biosynthetic protein FliR
MNYVDLLSNLPNLTIMGVIPLFFLIIMRLAPSLVLAPFFGAKLAPGIAKMGLALCMATVFLPFVAANTKVQVSFNNAFLFYSLKEILIGIILGFFITIPFYMVQTSGTIIDYLRGASIMQSQDPSMQTQTSPIGILYNYVLIVIFFQIDGPILFFDAVLKSYELVPPAALINSEFLVHKNNFWNVCFDLVNQIITIAIQMAAPAIVSILMAEMFLGIANRLAPQVQIAFLGMSIKSLLGLSLLWAAWFFILKQFTKQAYNWLDLVNKLIYTLKGLNPLT